MGIKKYVEENLPLCIRQNTEDDGPRYGLPYPYLVPSATDMFQEMYYWDTYFANTGLILRGNVELAKNNVDNLLYLLERFGFVPNGNHKYLCYNSQPPFLACMVREIYDETKDKEWLAKAYELLKKENDFWTQKRQTDCGLSRYFCEELPKEWIAEDAAAIVARLGFRPEDKTDEELAIGYRTSGECGWDLTPRLNWEGYNYIPVDLNAILYGQEEQLAYFAGELDKPEQKDMWHAKSQERATLMHRYLRDKDGIFCDYNMKTDKHNGLLSAASFFPLYFQMATLEEAKIMKHALSRIEMEYGVAVCEKSDMPGNYQWGYPNGWPPMMRIVAQGLKNYGYEEDAQRIADKYVRLVETCFEETGHLWEKYNVVKGNIEVKNEYKMPAMLGWTFGTYYFFRQESWRHSGTDDS